MTTWGYRALRMTTKYQCSPVNIAMLPGEHYIQPILEHLFWRTSHSSTRNVTLFAPMALLNLLMNINEVWQSILLHYRNAKTLLNVTLLSEQVTRESLIGVGWESSRACETAIVTGSREQLWNANWQATTSPASNTYDLLNNNGKQQPRQQVIRMTWVIITACNNLAIN